MVQYAWLQACCIATTAAMRPAAARITVWPPPQTMVAEGGSTPIDKAFEIFLTEHDGSYITQPPPRLQRAMDRFGALVRSGVLASTAEAAATRTVSRLLIQLDTDASTAVLIEPTMETLYNYTLTKHAGSGQVLVQAASIFGAIYGMETFAQMVQVEHGVMSTVDKIYVEDAPDYQWRGKRSVCCGRHQPVRPRVVCRNLSITQWM